MTTIRIKRNTFDEYEVPTTSTKEIYFTDDRQDAVDTARFFHGADISVSITRGTYS